MSRRTNGGSPERLNLIAEELKRSNYVYESPTRHDPEFYIRKLTRLENQMNILQDELSAARVRLRKAEDFQIKYQMVVKNNHGLQADIDRLHAQIRELQVSVQQHRVQAQQDAVQIVDLQAELKAVKEIVQGYKQRLQDQETKQLQKMYISRERQQAEVNREAERLRQELVNNEQRYQTEISQLRRQLQQKSALDDFLGAKTDRIRLEKDKEITRLAGLLDKHRIDTQILMQEKEKEFEQLRLRHQQLVQDKLGDIQTNLVKSDENFERQIVGLRELLAVKNQQIDHLMAELNQERKNRDHDRSELKKQNSGLSDTIYKIQREAELELFGLKERLTTIHAADIKLLNEKNEQHIATLKTNISQLERLLDLKTQQNRTAAAQHERVENDFRDIIAEKDKQIQRLLDRLSETGHTSEKHTKTLHQSLQQINFQKEEKANNYAQNLEFLDQQIKRLTLALEVKNAEIKGLQEKLSLSRRQYTEDLKEADRKWKEERKERESERARLRQSKEAVEEEGRQKEKNWRLKEKAYERVKEKDEIQIARLKQVLSGLEADNARLNAYIQEIDAKLKRQLRKQQQSSLEHGGARRELTSELERQQAQMDAVRRLEGEQLRKKFQIELDRTVEENKELRASLTQKNLQIDALQEQIKKMIEANRNLERANRDRTVEYQRRMAALNSEIYLTQNLYQNFIEAKSRLRGQLQTPQPPAPPTAPPA